MDLNPNPISVAKDAFNDPHEVAEHCLDDGVRLLIAQCAWLDSGADLTTSKFDLGTLGYWLHRLAPLCDPLESNSTTETPPPTYAIVVNRSGIDRGM